MVDVTCVAPTRIGGTDIEYAQGVRGGAWLFFTGHTATDFMHGLADEVAGRRVVRSAVRRVTGAKATSSWRDLRA
jgi:hypothetical protein